MDCCQVEGIESTFDRKKAAAKLAAYRKKGPTNTTRLLVDALRTREIQGQTLLDIGGGIGAIQHELLKHGIASAIDFEASSAYIEACKEESARQGHADQITHFHGDFANLNETVPPADIVTLERVICCYHDLPGLMNQACARTRRLLGLVFPYDRWWVRVLMVIVYNWRLKLQGNPFRVYMYPTQDVEALAQQHGFKRLSYQRAGVWQVVVYERTAPLA